MGSRKALLIIILLSCIVLPGFTQYVDYGQDRASLRWKQINTSNFQIIYPDFFESSAQEIANIYEALYHHSNSLGRIPAKISMIVHADGGISNGSVTWAPKRTDLYTTPQQEPSDSWLEHLCVHEFRHVVQIDKVNQGLSKILYYIFGEQLTIAVVGVYVPQWFLEGDAVCFETAVGHLGRGRSPEFMNEMKAQVVDKKIYNYSKAQLGSYKDFVPNRYVMGYYMTGLARVNYGNNIWADALTRVGRRPYGITPFAKSLKLTLKGRRDSLWQSKTFQSLFINADSVKKANTYPDAKKTLYHDNFSELQQRWKDQSKDVTNTFDTITTHNKYYTNYYYPTPVDNGNIIAYKTGLQETGAFVLLSKGQEHLLTRTGILYDNKFTYKNNKIVWSEYQSHIRWQQGGRMILASYDLTTGKYKKYHARYNRFSPFATDSGWGFVEVNQNNEASIVILDESLQQETFRITADRAELFIHPSYRDGQIVTVVQNLQGLHLESIDVATKERTHISEKAYYELDNPIQTGRDILYRASFNGNNAFYVQDQNTRSTRNIISSKYGVRFPAFNAAGDSLYFSFYTANGYKPGILSTQDFLNKPVEKSTWFIADTLKKLENWQLALDQDSVFQVKRYRKLPHLFNIHSWGPLYIGVKDKEIDFGLTVNSQNKLSTLSFSAGYIRDQDYDHGAFTFNGTYSGWWPVFELNLKTGGYNYYNSGILNVNNQQDTVILYNKSIYTKADLTTRLPLNLSGRNHNRTLQPYFRYKIESISRIRPDRIYGKYDYSDVHLKLPSRYYQLLEYGMYFSNQTRMTTQELAPRWGQSVSGAFSNTPLKNLNLGNIWWIEGRLYFPGLFRNHSLNLYAGHQEMSDRSIYFSNQILYPRGTKLYGYNLTTLRTNYQLPLIYPDLPISSLLYVKRVYGGVFYDLAKEKNRWHNGWYQSYGAELVTDTHILRIPFPIEIGIRTGYETQHKKMFADLLFSVGLNI